MRFRTWPVAALGLGGLLVLVVFSVLTASRGAQEIFSQLDQVNAHHRQVDDKLRRLRSDVHLSGIFVRDYLLDTERERAPEYRSRLAEFRTSNLATTDELRALMKTDGGDPARIDSLAAKLDEYWQTFEPLFDWTPTEKLTQSARFLRQQVLPRREAVLTIAEEIEALNNTNLSAQRVEVTRRYVAFRGDLHKLLWRSVALGALVAIVAVVRLRILERRSEQERALAEDAERQMRQLSQQLVATQEEERKKLSRELHDHVGQMLTALRMELGRIDRLRGPDGAIAGAVGECRQLVDAVVRVVRDLALGLRPSMLDDFGLYPALEWLVRDMSRRSGIDVELRVDGDVETLEDPYRTCVYRAVQEALTNCIRHSGARHVEVTIHGGPDRLHVSVIDDGSGINPARRRSGLGLRGIEERVRELHGTMSVHGTPGSGTMLILTLPVQPHVPEEPLASAAG